MKFVLSMILNAALAFKADPIVVSVLRNVLHYLESKSFAPSNDGANSPARVTIRSSSTGLPSLDVTSEAQVAREREQRLTLLNSVFIHQNANDADPAYLKYRSAVLKALAAEEHSSLQGLTTSVKAVFSEERESGLLNVRTAALIDAIYREQPLLERVVLIEAYVVAYFLGCEAQRERCQAQITNGDATQCSKSALGGKP